MPNLKITRKHHKHLNNPFPYPPKSLPFIQGSLFHNPHTVPQHQVFPVGNYFQLLWTTKDGGSISVSHQSQPSKALWSTIPGQAFVSAALCETEVEESRGSFAVYDRNILLVCDHQTIEDIRVISRLDKDFEAANGHDSLPQLFSFHQTQDLNETQFPALLMIGWQSLSTTEVKSCS